MAQLSDKKVAFLMTNGFEDVEFTSPWDAVTNAGGQPVLISPASGTVQGKKGHSALVDMPVAEARAADFDALVLPGGVSNGDSLRLSEEAVRFTKEIFAEHKPVAVICHGGWILTEADVLNGRTLTSYPSLRTDLINAGARWVDEEVHVDQGLVSSRTPDDLPAFCDKLVEEVAEGRHSAQRA